MSLNPLNELKRRLEDDATPLPKRLCLARNVVKSHHFPTAPKERLVAEWLENLTNKNQLSSEDIRNVIGWLSLVDELTSELKSKLVQVISQYVKMNPLQNEDIQSILTFMDDSKITLQLSLQIDDYLLITTSLLKYLKSEKSASQWSKKILSNITKYYKDSKRKLEFVAKFLDGEPIESVFSFLDSEYRELAIEVCRNVLFPLSKTSFFVSYLQTLIRKENINDLVAEKGDNIQSVLKIMSSFFEFPNGRTVNDSKYLKNFIDVFVNSFHIKSQIIYAFYILAASAIGMEQDYMLPVSQITPITFDENEEKIKRNLFLNMLEILLENEVDVSVRLTDTLGEKVSKSETKKNFLIFLQTVMLGQLKLQGKIDRNTIEIVKTALKLDPMLVEQKMDLILPPIMTSKKPQTIIDPYIELINCLVQTLFKLSRGTLFVNQILPFLKFSLESGNTDQLELKEKINESMENGMNYEKVKNKIITGEDVFHKDSVELYGKLTSEIMFRKNKELLESLQKDFHDYCLTGLQDGSTTPSTIVTTEVLSAILSSFFKHNKMADHTVPQPIAEEFWQAFREFESDTLKKFGLYSLKLEVPSITLSFLKLSVSFAHLKLLNLKYSNNKLDFANVMSTSEVLDLSVLLPCLTSEQWIEMNMKICDEDASIVLNDLLLAKTMAIDLLSKTETEDSANTRSYIVKHLSNTQILTNNYFSKALFSQLDKSQTKQVAKNLVKAYLADPEVNIFTNEAIINNKQILNAIVIETAKNIAKNLENAEDLAKALGKHTFDMSSFLNGLVVKEYFDTISMKSENQDGNTIKQLVEILKLLPIHYLEENYQLTSIFLLLAIKKGCNTKKSKRNIDGILLSIFELSPKKPDIYKLFPVEIIFDFDDSTLIDLLTLRLKSANDSIIKLVLEIAVKKVKTDSAIVTKLVEIVLTKQKKKRADNIDHFSDPAFQIGCVLLPIIAKEKKAITTSAFRSILANLQEKLHKAMLSSFKKIDFSSNLLPNDGNIDESVVVSENSAATLNAIGAFSLTLSKYCETNDTDEVRNLDYLWAGLEFFIKNAIQSIQSPNTNQHIETSIQLLNVGLRHIKKLESHDIFKEKDKLFHQIWLSVKSRLSMVFEHRQKKNAVVLDELSVTLKFVCELSSVECFSTHFVGDLKNLVELKKPTKQEAIDYQSTNHRVSHYLWSQCLKANIVGPKCMALAKLVHKTCSSLRFWIQQNYEEQNVAWDDKMEAKVVRVDEDFCEILKIHLQVVSDVVLAAKRISLDYKLLDTIFDLQHLVHYILGCNTVNVKCEIAWQSFYDLYEGCMGVLNSFLLSREELLEDRWPCFMQCYRALVSSLCERATSKQQLDRSVEDRLAEISHNLEKLTQSICKRKTHISSIAAYTVADICALLERRAPSKLVRQHLENCVSLLLQSSDSSYCMSFLKRALAGSPGHVTVSEMYNVYRSYRKYTGNA